MEEKERELDVTDTKVVRGIADHCPKCGEFELLAPLHGERGGPISCIQCGLKWHGEHGRRRKLGRIVVKAMKAFNNAGGSWSDYDKLKLAAMGMPMQTRGVGLLTP